ncbi:hypothetical protein [Nostoc sp. FACHB-892]|nr:hypothetical protein [Nostoc sp. FACHB-892]
MAIAPNRRTKSSARLLVKMLGLTGGVPRLPRWRTARRRRSYRLG